MLALARTVAVSNCEQKRRKKKGDAARSRTLTLRCEHSLQALSLRVRAVFSEPTSDSGPLRPFPFCRFVTGDPSLTAMPCMPRAMEPVVLAEGVRDMVVGWEGDGGSSELE